MPARARGGGGVSLLDVRPAGVLERLAEHADALGEIAAVHDARADGSFPVAAWDLLVDMGVARATTSPLSFGRELELVRRVASIDVGLGRLIDGHLNAVQRLAVQVEDEGLVAAELNGVRAGHLRLGVWVDDPGPGEGVPAHLRRDADGLVVHGVKTFCSGAGGLHRAFVLVHGDSDETSDRLAYVDLEHAWVDRDWFRGAGMRSCATHRVDFSGARVLWLAREPGALTRQPWVSRDAIRTAASWAGGADAAAAELVRALRAEGADGELEALAVARAQTAQRTIDLWLAAGGEALDSDPVVPELAALTAQLRHAVAEATRTILEEAGRACGPRPFATGGRLERSRRDLETHLLQHRLEPALVTAGRRALRG
jgi:hypothetical protein